jgi:hypothetical protein
MKRDKTQTAGVYFKAQNSSYTKLTTAQDGHIFT